MTVYTINTRMDAYGASVCLGVFTTREKAEAARARYKMTPATARFPLEILAWETNKLEMTGESV